MRIAIIDDEIAEQNLMEKYLGEWASQREILVEIKKYDNAESFLFSWEDDKDYDLLILDIEMGEMDGLALAKRIRREDELIPMMFVTGYDEYMQYGYDVAALHYLLKPVNKAKLFLILDKLSEKTAAPEKLILSTAEGPRSMAVNQMVYIEVEGHECVVHTRNEKILLKKALSSFEKEIEGKAGFVRCHRAFIVNMQYVAMVKNSQVLLDNDVIIPVSRYQLKKVQEAFIRFYKPD